MNEPDHNVMNLEFRVDVARSLLRATLCWLPTRLREELLIEIGSSLSRQNAGEHALEEVVVGDRRQGRVAGRQAQATAPPQFGRSVRACAGQLAAEHARQDLELERVFWSPASDEIRLLEVSRAIPFNTNRRILPFRFAPDPPSIPYPSLIVMVHPDDHKAIEAGNLRLPSCFDSKSLQLLVSRETS